MTGTGQVRIETPKTAAGRRVVTIDPGTVDALARLKDTQERTAARLGSWTSPYVATTQDGQPIYPKRLTDRFRATARAAGVPVIRLHYGRHSNVTPSVEGACPSRSCQHVSGTHARRREQTFFPPVPAGRR